MQPPLDSYAPSWSAAVITTRHQLGTAEAVMDNNTSKLEAAAKVIYDRETDRRDPGYKPWDLASEADRAPAYQVARSVIEEAQVA
jgi:hypothetical protein